jgi:hypothetical protein
MGPGLWHLSARQRAISALRAVRAVVRVSGFEVWNFEFVWDLEFEI